MYQLSIVFCLFSFPLIENCDALFVSLCYFSIKYCLTETSTSTISFSGVRTIDTKALYNCLLPLCCIFTAVSRIWLTGKYTGVTFWDVTSLISWVSGTVHLGKPTHVGIFLVWPCKMRHPSPLGCLTLVFLLILEMSLLVGGILWFPLFLLDISPLIMHV